MTIAENKDRLIEMLEEKVAGQEKIITLQEQVISSQETIISNCEKMLELKDQKEKHYLAMMDVYEKQIQNLKADKNNKKGGEI